MKRFTNPKNLDTKALYQMPKINTLYIHGLDSSPLPEKISIMEQAGMEVSALHLDYRTNKKVYHELKSLILEKNIEFIIGSSFGGMLAYWLGEELSIPVLLFNPAMVYQSVQVEIPEIKESSCPLRLVVLGEKDNVIDPKKNKIFFNAKERDGLTQKIVTCSWLEHSIDFQTFDEMVFWAVKNYSIWKIVQLSNKQE